VPDDAFARSCSTVELFDGDTKGADVFTDADTEGLDDDGSASKCKRASFLRRKATSSPPPTDNWPLS
jgi:hypothetical protein